MEHAAVPSNMPHLTVRSVSRADPFIGLLLQGRFLVQSYFAEGEFGKFYLATDMKNQERDVLIKISSDLLTNKNEFQILLRLNHVSRECEFPQILGGGEFIKHIQNFEKNSSQEKGAKSAESVRHSFIVMQKLGLNLSQILNMRNQRFSLKTVCQVGHRLVTILEKLHSIGKIYNDLKLENIIVGDGECSKPSMSHIRLIDFGLCTDYLDKDGSHIKFGYTKEFIGNMALSSKYAMGFHTVSRRDDMIQLSYLVIYMI